MKFFKHVCGLGGIALLVVLSGCFIPRSSGVKKNTKVEGEAGRTLPSHAISIDASYDPRLDNLIAGYKLVSVFIKNMSLRNIPMDDKQDRWVIVGERGARYNAVNSLRHKDPPLWREIPERMQNLIDYPEIVPINYSVTFDLLLPKNAKLDYFKEIRFYNAGWKQEFILEKEY